MNLLVSEEERSSWEAIIGEATRLQEADHQSNTLPSNTQPGSQPTFEHKNLKESDSGQDHRTLEHSNDCEAQQLAKEHRRLAIGVQTR